MLFYKMEFHLLAFRFSSRFTRDTTLAPKMASSSAENYADGSLLVQESFEMRQGKFLSGLLRFILPC